VVKETEVDKIGYLSTLSVQGVSFEWRSTLINMPMDQMKFLIKSVYDFGTSEQKQIFQNKRFVYFIGFNNAFNTTRLYKHPSNGVHRHITCCESQD